MSGSAKARRCARFCRSRSRRAMRGESGCSDVSSRIFSSYSAASPFSRRAQRSQPPITADSTSKLSHFHGALRVPATTAWSPLTLVAGRWLPSPSLPSGSSGARSERTPKTSSREATHVEWREPTGALRESSSDGTWASERYSAKRLAEKLSAAQLRIARKARPAGSGRRVPRSKYAGTRSEEHTSELQSLAYLVCRLLLEKK